MRFVASVCMILLISVFLIPMTTTNSISMDNVESSVPICLQESQYAPHEDIVIQSNQDFISQGWDGSGTVEEPFLISELDFTTDGIGISISDTTVFFSIVNCSFSASTDLYTGAGIKLTRVINGFVVNCDFTSINSGIMLEYADRCEVSGCTMELTNIPLTLYDSDECTIHENAIAGPVMVYESDGCIIGNNTQTQYGISEDSVGFEISFSDECVISNNTIGMNDYGLWIDCCWGTRVEDNKLLKNGLVLRGSDEVNYHIEESGNTINGYPLGYFYEETNSLIDASEFGQLILVSCYNVVVENGYFENATMGVLLAYSETCSVVNITSKNCVYGISFEHVLNCQLNESAIIGNYIGVMITELSAYVSINRNTIAHNTQGIGFDSAEACQVIENLIVDNSHMGLGVSGSGSSICYNTFGRNGMNAADGGFGNSWDNGVDCGNWWDDAILGSVYVIPGAAGSVDRFPNGTAGTFTPIPTTGNVWIGNGTLGFLTPEMLVVIASGAGIVVIFSVVLFTKRERHG